MTAKTFDVKESSKPMTSVENFEDTLTKHAHDETSGSDSNIAGTSGLRRFAFKNQQTLLRIGVECTDGFDPAPDQARDSCGSSIADGQPDDFRRWTVEKRLLPEVVVLGYDRVTVVTRVGPDRGVGRSAHPEALDVSAVGEVRREQ